VLSVAEREYLVWALEPFQQRFGYALAKSAIIAREFPCE